MQLFRGALERLLSCRDVYLGVVEGLDREIGYGLYGALSSWRKACTGGCTGAYRYLNRGLYGGKRTSDHFTKVKIRACEHFLP